MIKAAISTCLFGSSPRSYRLYAANAPASARFCQQYLPNWKFRVYHDNTVNKQILITLSTMSNVELIEMPPSIGRDGCFWRFLAFDDCDIAVCRDLDWRMQDNDILSMQHFASTPSLAHFIWVSQPRKTTKTARYYMAGCVGAKELPFKMADLMQEYKDDKTVFGADEWFLGKHFVPEVLKYQKKIPIYVEPQPKLVPKGKTKEYIEIFPEVEEYLYFDKNYEGI